MWWPVRSAIFDRGPCFDGMLVFDSQLVTKKCKMRGAGGAQAYLRSGSPTECVPIPLRVPNGRERGGYSIEVSVYGPVALFFEVPSESVRSMTQKKRS